MGVGVEVFDTATRALTHMRHIPTQTDAPHAPHAGPGELRHRHPGPTGGLGV